LRITANMVTISRILLLPIPCAFLIFGSMDTWWIAFVMLTLLGATDFIDGLMARREGPTRLGALLDPVADKIFIASIAFGLGGVGVIPAWTVAALLCRELLVMAFRSSLSLRSKQVKTSVFAKIKTVYQMGGFGTIFLTLALDVPWLVGTMLALNIGLLTVALSYPIKKKRAAPFWVWPVILAFFLVAALGLTISQELSVFVQVSIIVFITWASGIDYLIQSYTAFSKSMGREDLVRIAWVLAHSVFVVPLVGHFPVLVLPLLISMSSELALGGVDSVVAAEKHYAGILPFAITSLAATIFAALAWGNVWGFWSFDIIPYSIGLAVVSVLVFAAVFKKWGYLFKKAAAHI